MMGVRSIRPPQDTLVHTRHGASVGTQNAPVRGSYGSQTAPIAGRATPWEKPTSGAEHAAPWDTIEGPRGVGPIGPVGWATAGPRARPYSVSSGVRTCSPPHGADVATWGCVWSYTALLYGFSDAHTVVLDGHAENSPVYLAAGLQHRSVMVHPRCCPGRDSIETAREHAATTASRASRACGGGAACRACGGGAACACASWCWPGRSRACCLLG